HYPHLRLVSLIPRAEVETALGAMAPHVRGRVIAEPDPELLTSGQIQVMLTCDRPATHAMFPAVDLSHIVTWSDLGE
ncbi:hypothetical protein LLE87_40285, partial [Paenibacillus polymyxa]|nr:hypothetical protein [Paenibacillus polymyxa]